MDKLASLLQKVDELVKKVAEQDTINKVLNRELQREKLKSNRLQAETEKQLEELKYLRKANINYQKDLEKRIFFAKLVENYSKNEEEPKGLKVLLEKYIKDIDQLIAKLEN
jgi:hypothetical protein